MFFCDQYAFFADELPVQFMGVNDFHGALEQTGTARLEGETVKTQEQPHFWQPIERFAKRL